MSGSGFGSRYDKWSPSAEEGRQTRNSQYPDGNEKQPLIFSSFLTRTCIRCKKPKTIKGGRIKNRIFVCENCK